MNAGRRLLVVAVAAYASIWIGLLGAWAFNPDNGTAFHSAALGEFFGLLCYAGAAVTPLALVAGIVLLIVGRVRRGPKTA